MERIFLKLKLLEFFSTPKDALEFEERILTRVNAKRNPKFLNQTNGDKNFYNKQHTEETKAKLSKIQNNRLNENTERGRKLRENASEKSKAQFDKNTEYGRKQREIQAEIKKTQFDKNTEDGRKRREDMSKTKNTQYDINTEQGRRLREKISKTLIQKRKDTSIIGELMFNEAFIRENFLITDDKNDQRFLWSVYSKLTGYSKSHISKEKREGKLSFLYGIKSISLAEELENSKIKEIECSLKEA